MKISPEIVNMLHLSTEFARDAIKMSAIVNGAGTLYVFTQSPAKSEYFISGAACFALGLISCLVCAFNSYLAQWKYGMAAQSLEKKNLEEHAKLNADGNKRRAVIMLLWCISVAFFAIGCSIVVYGYFKLL
jgi:hypothetical protein